MGTKNDDIFDKGKSFWQNYLRGRPKPPATFFQRIFNYHESHGGSFGTVHDVGAGNAPFASILSSRFDHVILSDAAEANMVLAKERLGPSDQFTYRTAKLDEIDDLPIRTIDMVFASNVMHFAADQQKAMAAIAKELKPGGTFACIVFGPGHFADVRLQNLWSRISQQGGRELLKKSNEPQQTALVMARTDGLYNVAPLDSELWTSGCHRIHMNMGNGGIMPLLPAELSHLNIEPNHTGADDKLTFEDNEELMFDIEGSAVLEHMLSFPFVDPSSPTINQLLQEVSDVIADRDGKTTFRGWWPAKLILATATDK